MEELLVQMLAEGTGGEPVPEAQEEMVQNEAIQNEAMQDETIIIEESKGEEEEMDMMDMEEMELERDLEASDETSVITQAMTITGDLSTQGSVDVIGTVNGNIDALGKLNITGHVNGNSKAAEIYAESAKINGEIVSEGAVKIGASSVIIGNITATSAAIAGAVKGDIDVRGPVILDASAIVMGNIKSKSVQINNGAVIEGMCSQCYADVSPTTFFDEYKPEPIRKAKAKQGEQRENKS
ncbi:MAG: polymer-forming cytoskeletal protein [Acetatifactor sp.]|nr:polymer-forming cytoskeletal protein [Acetatifactor sp.]